MQSATTAWALFMVTYLIVFPDAAVRFHLSLMKRQKGAAD